MKRGAVAIGLVASTLTAAAAAAPAEPGRAAPSAEVATLERELSTNYARLTQSKLSAPDCEMACRALGSMRRASERICALEPGARCEDARKRTNEAEALVRDACPTCNAVPDEAAVKAGAAKKAPSADAEATADAKPVPVQVQAKTEAEGAASAPRRGGCASCAAAQRGPGAGEWALFAAVFGVLFARRRRNRREASRTRRG